MEQDLPQFAVLIIYDNSTVCGEMDDYFATEADTMIDIVHVFVVDLKDKNILNIHIQYEHLSNCLI